MDVGGKFFVSNSDSTGDSSLLYSSIKYLVTSPGQFSAGRMAAKESSIFTFSDYEIRQSLVKMVRVSLDYVTLGTEEFRAMDQHKRGCYYPEELELQIFPLYSEANCVLECSWHVARERCGCVPWFLSDYFPGTLMCEATANRCIRSVVNARYDKRHYHLCKERCLPDCEKVQYDAKLEGPDSLIHPRNE